MGELDPVRDDLEEYFELLDRQRLEAQRGNAGAPPLEAPSVSRFSAEGFGRLRKLRKNTAEPGAECSICLRSLRGSADVVVLPCAAAHCFHAHCIRGWLSKSVHCPLCREDVQALLPPASSPPAPQARRRAASVSAVGTERRTRGGGRVVAYLPQPPSTWARPAYIPAHLRHLAEYLEISYPGRGTARIWRVPSAAAADLSEAVPVEEG